MYEADGYQGALRLAKRRGKRTGRLCVWQHPCCCDEWVESMSKDGGRLYTSFPRLRPWTIAEPSEGILSAAISGITSVRATVETPKQTTLHICTALAAEGVWKLDIIGVRTGPGQRPSSQQARDGGWTESRPGTRGTGESLRVLKGRAAAEGPRGRIAGI